MPDDLWSVPVQEFMRKGAQKRAEHYREQAAQLREIGGREPEGKSRTDILELANKYDYLARRANGAR